VRQFERERHQNSAAQHKESDPTKRAALAAANAAAKQRAHELQTKHQALWDQMYAEAERLPNLVSPQTPIGPEDKAKTLHVGGKKRTASPAPPSPSSSFSSFDLFVV
jgi:seryl-tRNA synthetase